MKSQEISLYLSGVTPLIENKEGTEYLEKVVHIYPESAISEAFRKIATSTLRAPSDRPLKCLLVTSTQSREGKTTTASNLALSLAQSGLRVILVDTNLRTPRLHRIFLNGDNKPGLSTYLGEKNRRLIGVTRNTDIDRLDVIPAGPIPSKPAKLLGSEKMKRLLKTLRKNYDYVILDGPPITGFAESQNLSRLADRVLLVTSVGITSRQNLRSSIEENINLKGKIVGAVVNRVEPRSGEIGHSVYYGDGQDVNEENIERDETNSLEIETASIEPTPSVTHEKDADDYSRRKSRSFIPQILLALGIVIVIYYLVESDSLFNPNAEKSELTENNVDIEEPEAVPPSMSSTEKAPSASGATTKGENALAGTPKESKDVIGKPWIEAETTQEGKKALQITKGTPPSTKTAKEMNRESLPVREIATSQPTKEERPEEITASGTDGEKELTVEDLYDLAKEIQRELE